MLCDFELVFFIFGSLFGSFLNVVGYRVPKGESIFWPGSHCPICHRALKPYELIPICSWLVLGGKCKTCNSDISIRYPIIELASAALWTASYLFLPNWPLRIIWCFFWFLMLACVATDLTSMRVPNILSLPGFLIIFFLSIWSGQQYWLYALGGALLGSSMIFLVHLLSRGNMGLGDAKLYLSIGAFLGPVETVLSFVLAAFAGSLLGILMRMTGLIGKQEKIPFVPYIFIGVILSAFFGKSLLSWYVHLLNG